MERKEKDKYIVKVKNVTPEPVESCALPLYASAGAAGADLRAYLNEPVVLKPGQRCAIPTGVAIQLPDCDTVALIFARSGLAAKKGVALSNGVGVIDADYRGEIKVLLSNLGTEDVSIAPGERIAQILFVPVRQASFVWADALDVTERGDGGFGSTG